MNARTLVLGGVLGLLVSGAAFAAPPSSSAAGAPVLLGSGPLYAYTGTGDFTLTLWGYNIEDDTVIRWNGFDLATTVHSSGQASAPVTAAMVSADAVVTLTLHTPGQGPSADLPFEVKQGSYGPPTIERLGMSQVVSNATVRFQIQGRNFGASTSVTVDGVPVPVRVVSKSLLYTDPVTAPADPGVMAFRAFNGAPGGGQTGIRNLTVVAPPVGVADITTVGPSPAKPRSPSYYIGIYVSGTIPGGTKVELDGSALPVLQRDSNNIMALVPASALTTAGNLPVVVRGVDGTASAPKNLVVTDGPVAAPAIQSNSLVLREGIEDQEITFFAQNAGPNAYVTWNGTPLLTTVHGDSFVGVSIPAEILAQTHTAEIVLVNPPPHSASSTPIFRTVFEQTDMDCDGDTDADDVRIVLAEVTGSGTAPCSRGNPDGFPGPLRLQDAVVTARVAAGLE